MADVVRKRFLQCGHVGWRCFLVLLGTALVIVDSYMDRRFPGLVVLVCLAAHAAAERHRLGHCESSTAVAAFALLHELITSVMGKVCVLVHTKMACSPYGTRLAAYSILQMNLLRASYFSRSG